MIVLEEKVDNYYCGAIGESRKPFYIGYDTGINRMRQNKTTIKEAKIDGFFAPW